MSGLIPKAVDFTTGTAPRGGETRVLEVWLVIVLEAIRVISLPTAQRLVRLINSNPTGTLAGRSLGTGLLAEHLRSLLPDDEADGLPEDRAALDDARAAFELVVREFLERQIPGTGMTPEDPHGGHGPLDPGGAR